MYQICDTLEECEEKPKDMKECQEVMGTGYKMKKGIECLNLQSVELIFVNILFKKTNHHLITYDR